MCGKFSAMMTWGEYCDLADVGTSGTDSGPDAMDPSKMLGTSTPMSNIPVLHLNQVGIRRITPMRWGWYNHKLADPRRGFNLHARSEEIDRTPTWIEPFHKSRGVVFTKSFNIGEELPSGKAKQWVCSQTDGQPVAIAVIYSAWDTSVSFSTGVRLMTDTGALPNEILLPSLVRPTSQWSANMVIRSL
jgi:putative SOS response-associated peptidase YedK